MTDKMENPETIVIDIDLDVCVRGHGRKISFHRFGIDLAAWAAINLGDHDNRLCARMERLDKDIDYPSMLKTLFLGIVDVAPPEKKILLVFNECDFLAAFPNTQNSAAVFQDVKEWQSQKPALQNLSVCFAGWKPIETYGALEKPFSARPIDRTGTTGFEFNQETLDVCRTVMQTDLISDKALHNIFQQTQGHPQLTMYILRDAKAAIKKEGPIDDARAAEITRQAIDKLHAPNNGLGTLSIWDYCMKDYKPPACYLPQNGAAALRQGPLMGYGAAAEKPLGLAAGQS